MPRFNFFLTTKKDSFHVKSSCIISADTLHEHLHKMFVCEHRQAIAKKSLEEAKSKSSSGGAVERKAV